MKNYTNTTTTTTGVAQAVIPLRMVFDLDINIRVNVTREEATITHKGGAPATTPATTAGKKAEYVPAAKAKGKKASKPSAPAKKATAKAKKSTGVAKGSSAASERARKAWETKKAKIAAHISAAKSAPVEALATVPPAPKEVAHEDRIEAAVASTEPSNYQVATVGA